MMDDDEVVNDPEQLRKNLDEYRVQLQEVRRSRPSQMWI